MEFKKGKKVRVISNNSQHKYIVGSIVTMSTDEGHEGFCANEIVKGCGWYIEYSDCEEIGKKKVVDKPERYKSREVNGLDVIALAEHWKLNFQEANILKYLLRDKGEDESDMQKIADYAKRELELIKQRKNK